DVHARAAEPAGFNDDRAGAVLGRPPGASEPAAPAAYDDQIVFVGHIASSKPLRKQSIAVLRLTAPAWRMVRMSTMGVQRRTRPSCKPRSGARTHCPLLRGSGPSMSSREFANCSRAGGPASNR